MGGDWVAGVTGEGVGAGDRPGSTSTSTSPPGSGESAGQGSVASDPIRRTGCSGPHERKLLG